ncbi:MAG: pyridoxamine 5'-phosphate oxidase family protein [Actinomycetota bacterium]|nr:pyridoxamine 5'-phosphate oxidase family protein [Actinomycetota bacterium]
MAVARHGVLATVHPNRGVDAVPVVFAVVPALTSEGASAVSAAGTHGRSIVIPVDTVKPKRSSRLQRLVNIDEEARCVLLVDHYDEEWSKLWWVQVHAHAARSEPTEGMIEQLAGRYPPYGQPGSVVGVITLQPTNVSGWSASGDESIPTM